MNLLSVFQGNKPDITPAAIKATLIATIPLLANILHVFGVYDLSKDQEEALKQMAGLAAGFASFALLADAYLRGKRNIAQATVDAAALVSTSAPSDLDVPPSGEALPSDEEEAASPPPDASNVPVQPSQAQPASPTQT